MHAGDSGDRPGSLAGRVLPFWFTNWSRTRTHTRKRANNRKARPPIHRSVASGFNTVKRVGFLWLGGTQLRAWKFLGQCVYRRENLASDRVLDRRNEDYRPSYPREKRVLRPQ